MYIKKKGFCFRRYLFCALFYAFSLLSLVYFSSAILLMGDRRINSIFITAYAILLNFIFVLGLCFLRLKKSIALKTSILIVCCFFLLSFVFYLTIKYDIISKINSVDKIRAIVSSFGSYAVIIYVVIQFLQVVVLPIPSSISVGAGVLLFGPFFASIYSVIGILSGSLVAFLIGKYFGYNIVKWIIGEKRLDKALKSFSGTNSFIFLVMFLLPFFPDDLLCFVAGLISIDFLSFFLVSVVSRTVTIFLYAFSINNSLIPYNTWWGILIWCAFFIAIFISMYFAIKHGKKLEN